MGRRFSRLIPYISYNNRAQLRQASSSTGDLREVEDLGIFMFVSGLVEPDDDETCFATTSGAWILQSPSVDVIDSLVRPELEEIQEDVSVLQNQIRRVTSEQNGILTQLLQRTVVLYDSERDNKPLGSGTGSTTNQLQLMWKDIGITDHNKIVCIEFLLNNFATTGNDLFYVTPINEFGQQIGGTWGGALNGFNGGASALNTHVASGSGRWYFPTAGSVQAASTAYGSGVTGHIVWQSRTYNDGSTGQNYFTSNVSGLVGYLQGATNWNRPNTEQFAWDNADTNTIPHPMMGFHFSSFGGSFKQGSFTVRITYLP